MSKEYVNKFQYLSYDTVFDAKGDKDLDCARNACFAPILNRGTNIHNEEYNLYLVHDPKYALNKNRSNLCFLSLKQLKKHIYLARRLFPFEYSVEETEYEGYPTYKVHLKLNANHFYHRYLLTWIRYAYEFPFNLILMDAIRMKHCYLNRESIANLFVLCANSYCEGPEFYNSGHAISYQGCNFLKERLLKAGIDSIAAKNDKYSRVNDLYRQLNPVINKKYPRLKGKNSRYLEYWIDQDDFEKRAKVYLKGYKILKNKK